MAILFRWIKYKESEWEDFCHKSSKDQEGNQFFYFPPSAMDIMLSFVYKEKEKLGDFKTLQAYQNIHFSDMGGDMPWSLNLQLRNRRLKICWEVNK